jgi:hypothetical protein
MITNNRLLTVLYILSHISMRIMQLILLSTLIFEFIPEGSLGSYSTNIHHSKGYPVNAKIHLQIPDTLINYKINNQSGSIAKSNNKEFNRSFDEIKKDNSYTKTYQINSFEIYNNSTLHEVKKETLNPTIQFQDSEIKVTLNPKDYFFKSILVLKNYLSLGLLLFISFQSRRLFKQLRTNFAFNDVLNQRIKNIGYSLIAYQVINFIASIITTRYLTNINYYHYFSNIDYSRFNFLNLTTSLEYNITILFLGLCCLVLAKLLKYGYDLQNENDLTI